VQRESQGTIKIVITSTRTVKGTLRQRVSTLADCSRSSRIAHLSALSSSRGSRPNDGHSIAIGLAPNASGGVQAEVADGPHDVVVALGEWRRAGPWRGTIVPARAYLKVEFRSGLTQLRGGTLHKERRDWQPESFVDLASQHPLIARARLSLCRYQPWGSIRRNTSRTCAVAQTGFAPQVVE